MGPSERAVLVEFIAECRENLDRIDSDLISLEAEPNDGKRLASVFRAMHTIKGSCGWLGFANLERLTHAGESLLTRVREQQMALDGEVITELLHVVDLVRRAVDGIEATGSEGAADYEGLIALLGQLEREAVGGDRASLGLARTEDVDAVRVERTVRVDVGLLDRLMNLVGELVLTRNQIAALGVVSHDPGLGVAAQRLNLVTSELQDGIMKTRMHPIRQTLAKFPRMLRDLATSLGKQVELRIEGAATELDRSLAEAVSDPLTHLIRNAVDHGIESPDERVAAGKPPQGRISIRAFHAGGKVNIHISDDGRGLDPERIRQRALSNALVSADRVERMGPRELFNLVFVPGFSTASSVTTLSGRGVGLDIARANIERIGGTVDVESELGRGTTFKLEVPLTLAIIPALIVACAGRRYAIPQVNTLELVRLADAVEHVHGAPVYRLRGELLPLVHLRGVFAHGRGRAVARRSENLIVLEAEGRRFGLVVDSVQDTEEIVVKPLGRLLRKLPMFAGATILGDGKIALILDVLGIARTSRLLRERENVEPHATPSASSTELAGSRDRLLIVGVGASGRLAVPLDEVARLEEFPRERIERVGGREVIQYRERILALVRVEELLEERRSQPREPTVETDAATVPVVVFGRGRGSVGLIVDRIIDIVEQAVELEREGARRGVLGTAVIQGRVTEILELDNPALRQRSGAANVG